MKAILNFLVGIINRFNQVIQLRAGADGSQIRPDVAADAANGMTGRATLLLTPVNPFAAGRVAAVEDGFGQFHDFALA